MEIIDVLSRQEPFSALERNDLSNISSTFYFRNFKDNVLIVSRDRPMEEAGFIVTGAAMVLLKDHCRNDCRAAMMGEGDYFGPMAYVLGCHPALRAASNGSVRCLVQPFAAFLEMIRKSSYMHEFFHKTALQQISDAACKLNGVKGEFDVRLRLRPRLPSGVQKSLRFIDSHFQSPILLQDLARESCMSRYHFSRIFKKEVGCCFKEYLNRKRIKEAKILMETYGMNATEACFAVGFNNVSYFTQVFKAMEGMTPSAFRKSI